MKKLLCLMVALMVAPAMAGVTLSLVQTDECALDLVVTADGADTVDGAGLKSLVAGLALNVSVGAGETIDSVVPAVEGVSTAGNLGYGIFMGTITFVVTDPDGTPGTGDETTDIDSAGTPVAPATAPDAPGQLPGESCVLEFAGLYDVAVGADAPDAATTLARIYVSDGATVTISEEAATRGGIVNIGGAAPSGVTMPAPTQVDSCITDCYLGPDQVEWVAVGKPESWCTDYQCQGDADDATETFGRNQRRVGYADVDILVVGFNQPYSGDPAQDGGDPDSDPDTWIAADFDHAAEAFGRNQRRVGYADVDILVAYFNDGGGTNPPPGGCNDAP